MKHLLYLISFIICVFFFSCGKETDMAYSGDEVSVPSASLLHKRTYEEALLAAQQSLEMVSSSETRGNIANSRTLDLKTGVKAILSNETRNGINENDTLMYVFNFNNNAGFAIISADADMLPIIAVTEKGHYDPDIKTDNEGFDYFMEQAKEYVQNGKTQKEEQTRIPDPIVWITYEDVLDSSYVVGNFVNVEWGQDNVEGVYCPNGVCGCGATAIVQAMSYYEYPTSINININDTLVVNNLSLNWSDMKQHVSMYNCTATSSGHDAISLLCRQVGVDTHSYYVPGGGTGIDTLYIDGCFLKYGYMTSGRMPYSQTHVNQALDSSHIILMRGGTGTIGHVWLIDGYRVDKYIRKEKCVVYPLQIDWWYTGNEEIFYCYYNHINWGWHGDCNGYFNYGVFDTQQRQLSSGQGNHYYNFFNNQFIIEVYR